MRKKSLFIIALPIISIVLFIIFIIKNQEDSFADEIITTTTDTFKSSFQDFLSTIDKTINTFNKDLKDEAFLIEENLTPHITKVINSESFLTGIALSNDSFSYLIFKDNSSWAVSYDGNLSDSTSNWQRLNNKLEVKSEWTDIYTAFPSNNNIDSIKSALDNSNYVWVASDHTIPESKNTISIIFKSKKITGEEIIAGLIYYTPELKNKFADVMRFENPLISIITTDNNIITPLVNNDSSNIKFHMDIDLNVKKLINKWSSSEELLPHSYSFEKNNSIYWTRIVNVPSMIGIKGFSVTISAHDLAITERNKERIYLYLSITFAIMSLVALFFFLRKPRLKGDKLFPMNLDIADVKTMIKGGETEYVEFKSSLRWDYRESKSNKILEEVIMKSICAFANAKGGNLFIGVNDELEIIGLDNDFNSLKKNDADYFELHLRKLIVNQYGIAFSNDNLKISFPKINDKIICIIQIKASKNPIFLKTRNKQGNEIEKFYVRSGNASQQLSSLTDINEYVKIRFDG
ncbi:MAG: ATP-binding protein [Lentimicrobiaceae bacterium]|nr:ATP-binding protein [Lentimicrobiaceae bacterium]